MGRWGVAPGKPLSMCDRRGPKGRADAWGGICEDSRFVAVRLEGSDAVVLFQLLLPVLHPSTGVSPAGRAAVLSLACQLKRGIKTARE